MVQTRAGGRAAKRVTVGRHGVVTAEEARRRAALIITRIKAGEEPVPKPLRPAEGPSVAELARAYLEEHVAVRCKPKTVEMYGQAVRKHILPALGRMPALAVEHVRVSELHHKLRGDAVHGEPRGGRALADIQRGWGPGADPRGRQPVPAGGQVP